MTEDSRLLRLRAAVLADPVLADLRGQALLQALNATLVAPLSPRRVPREEVERVCVDRGRLLPLQAAAQQGNQHAIAACYLVLQARLPTVNLDSPAFTGAIAGLVAAGILSAEDVAAVEALATRETTLAREITGWGVPVSIQDLAAIKRD